MPIRLRRRAFICPAVVRLLALVSLAHTSVANAAPAPQRPLEERPTFSDEVHIATVAVTVTDRNRIPIADLTIDDFEVLEEGRAERTAFLLRPGETPLEVAVLLDTSGSIGRAVPDLRPLPEGFVNGLDPRDCVLALPFSDTVGPGYWNVDIERFVLDFSLSGMTRLNDAIIGGMGAFELTAQEVQIGARDARPLAPERFGRAIDALLERVRSTAGAPHGGRR